MAEKPPEARRLAFPGTPDFWKLVCPHCNKRHFFGEIFDRRKQYPDIPDFPIEVYLKNGYVEERPNYWRFHRERRWDNIPRGRELHHPWEDDPNVFRETTLPMIRNLTTNRHPVPTAELFSGVHIVQCDKCLRDVTVTVK